MYVSMYVPTYLKNRPTTSAELTDASVTSSAWLYARVGDFICLREYTDRQSRAPPVVALVVAEATYIHTFIHTYIHTYIHALHRYIDR